MRPLPQATSGNGAASPTVANAPPGRIIPKLRVEIVDICDSPCEIAVLGPESGDLTRGIADFGYFNPYCGAPAHASRQGIAIGAVCLARPPDRTGGKPRRGRHRTPEPLRQADIPDLINIGVFSALYFALVADLIAKAGKYSSKIGMLISYVVFANINTDTS